MKKYCIIFLAVIILSYNYSIVEAENLISDPEFTSNWSSGGAGEVYDSRFMLEKFAGDVRALGIVAGRDRQGMWSTQIKACKSGEKYRFQADFYRSDRSDSWAYPEIRVWGKLFRLDTHRMYGDYQRLFVELECPHGVDEDSNELSFINSYPGNTFWMRQPQLFRINETDKAEEYGFQTHFFPVGAYGGSADNLAELKTAGLNSAIVSFKKENLQTCVELNVHCTLSVPRDPEKLIAALDAHEEMLNRGRFAFYVNDEPGIHSFPIDTAEEIQRILKERFPDSFTSMAIVRPQVISEYRNSADFFMLDQYPVPGMPMVWLADSMDVAAEQVGSKRLQSVIQAFGGDKYAAGGWPRLPTFQEMNNLAFLSVVHGSRGIYFYTYPSITSTEEGRQDFIRVVQRLNSVRSWLNVHNNQELVDVELTSRYRFDPEGKPALHCARKEQHGTSMYICVNTLRTRVQAEIGVGDANSRKWQDYFSGEPYYVVNDNLLGRFEPLEVKVLLESH